MTTVIEDHKINKKTSDTVDNRFFRKIQGNNIILTEVISHQDPFADLHKSMREETWYWDSNYDY